MINKGFTVSKYSLLLLFFSVLLCAEPAIEVEGLFKGGAILRIDGQQKMLRVGQQDAGIKVLEATTQYVIIELDGQQKKLNMNRNILGAAEGPATPEVNISRNKFNRYITYATINGRRTKVLVDTGANIVAMSSLDAKALGVPYLKGRKSKVVTASGVAEAYDLVLPTVTVGAITVSGVQASVVEGRFPDTVLLGMSFLESVDMQESNGVMTLRRKY
ncbi:MAG: aspartyl protease family protein [Pseudohongiellaceae bacterium]|jgi:aspartyl protease family protein